MCIVKRTFGNIYPNRGFIQNLQSTEYRNGVFSDETTDHQNVVFSNGTCCHIEKIFLYLISYLTSIIFLN